MFGTRHHRGLSAASGIGWFFLFVALTVGVLSYKGVGVITYPPEAATIPVIGSWLNVPATAPVEDETGRGRQPSQQELLQQQVSDLTAKIENHQRTNTDLQAQIEQRDTDIMKLQGDLARLQDQLNLQKDSQKLAVAKIYERMNTADAVKILEGMEPERAAIIIGNVKQDAAAELLAGFDPARARLLSDILAGYSRPLDSVDVRPPASATIAPGTLSPPGGAPVVPGAAGEGDIAPPTGLMSATQMLGGDADEDTSNGVANPATDDAAKLKAAEEAKKADEAKQSAKGKTP